MGTVRDADRKRIWNATKKGLEAGGVASSAAYAAVSTSSAIATMAGAAAVSNPVALAVTGGACALFCCIDACINYHADSPTHAAAGEAASANTQPPAPPVEAKSEASEQSCCFPLCSLFSRKKQRAIESRVMEEKREIKEVQERKEVELKVSSVRWHR